MIGGTCMDWEEERRKNGIEEGVSRFDWVRRTDDDGLRGLMGGADKADVV